MELVLVYYREGKRFIQISETTEKEIQSTKFRSRLHLDEEFYIFKQPQGFEQILKYAKNRNEAIESLFLSLTEKRKQEIFYKL